MSSSSIKPLENPIFQKMVEAYEAEGIYRVISLEPIEAHDPRVILILSLESSVVITEEGGFANMQTLCSAKEYFPRKVLLSSFAQVKRRNFHVYQAIISDLELRFESDRCSYTDFESYKYAVSYLDRLNKAHVDAFKLAQK